MPARLVLLMALVLAGVTGALALPGGFTTRTVVHDGLTVECSGWTGVTDGCAAWGEEVRAAGAPSATFELEDVVRLRFNRGMLGLASDCTVEYYLGRYPDDVAWSAEIACRES